MAEQPKNILKLVDEHGNLASNGDIEDFMRELPENITVVSIIGPQNTGKSHLLNCLFGTNFQTLPPDENWRPVTHGIWIGRCTHDSSMVIMDIEGSDSIQRAQDETSSFDYIVAFFALKISHVVLVNLDRRNVGQNNGGCVSLLRMIFLETIRQQMCKPRVVMTIRDCHNPEHPHDQNRAVRQMVEIWESVHGRRRNIELHDFIEKLHQELTQEEIRSRVAVVYAELFPYFGCEEDFRRKCSELREKLTPAELRQGHKPQATSHKPQENLNITAATFSTIIREIWTSIMNNECFNIPSSNIWIKYLAKLKMRQILDSEPFPEEYAALRTMENSTCPLDFEAKLKQYLQSVMDRFDDTTGGLTEWVKDQVRQRRMTKVINELKSKFVDILETKMHHVAEEAKRMISIKLSTVNKSPLSSLVGIVHSNNRQAFDDLSVERIIYPHIKQFNTSCKSSMDEYNELVELRASQLQEDLTEYVMQEIKKLQWSHEVAMGIGSLAIVLLSGGVRILQASKQR